MSSSVVVAVGLMYTRTVTVPKGTPAEIEQAVRAALTDPITGDWKVEQFQAAEASIKLAVVEPAARAIRAPAASRIVAMLPLATTFVLTRLLVL